MLTRRQLEFTSTSRDLAAGPTEGRAKGKRGKMQELSPIVTVFGAGIAGLSAAHELIERGFVVQVVEPTRSPDEEWSAEVGGLARNQFGRIPANPYVLHAAALEPPYAETAAQFREHIEVVIRMRSNTMRPVQQRFPVPWRIAFAGRSELLDGQFEDDWHVRNNVKLHAAWDALTRAFNAYSDDLKGMTAASLDGAPPDAWLAREQLYVEIRGHSCGDGSEAENRDLSLKRAQAVRDHLERLNKYRPTMPAFADHFVCVGVGSAEPLGDQRDPIWRARSNRVEFRIVEQLVPGEHGYRFFPAFYRHLFDTMRRTPILDDAGHATGQTAFDRLVATPDLGLALGDGRPPQLLETRRIRSLEELRKMWELFFDRLGVTHRDLARFAARMLKYLSSSPERRASEYENQSWWTFIGGDSPRGYSAAMRHYLMETPQALIAVNAEETDAHSQGNIISQLQLHYLENACDFTLSGPTSDVWLRAWKKYLKRQGVRFFVGNLVRLAWHRDPVLDRELLPVTAHKEGWLFGPVSEGEKGMTDVPLVAWPQRRALVVEVLDADDGDYIVAVSGTPHCVVARGRTCHEIADELATTLTKGSMVWAHARGCRLLIREQLATSYENWGKDATFLEWDDQAHQMLRRTFDRKWLEPKPSKQNVQKLLELLEAHDASLLKTSFREHGKGDEHLYWPKNYPPLVAKDSPSEATTRLSLTDRVWCEAGVLRAKDAAFDDALSRYEARWCREVVPRISVDASTGHVGLHPPKWVEEALAHDDDTIAHIHTLCPYHFRGAAATDDSGPGIWITVSNAHDNLAVRAEPMPEDPTDDYLSPNEEPRAFQPDFYVLALPLTEASKLVWRAERDRPGVLHGCLAEILDFDRHTQRRSADGMLVRPVRDAYGRPPHDYPLRDFAGVQYYFQNQVRIGKGHIYFPGAEWGLSSISQLAYWRERMSPAGPFIGQLSVDIGNLYHPAPPRLANRIGRCGWNSTSQEIAEEVWFQVRQGLDRERAGVLVAPNFYHLDEGLSFKHPLGSRFRGRAIIAVENDTDATASYTVWVNDRPFRQTGGDAATIAGAVAHDINWAPPGALKADARQRDGRTLLVIRSTVPDDGALIVVTGDIPGSFEVVIAGKTYCFMQSPSQPESSRLIRDGLFDVLASDSHLPVIVNRSSETGILLMPKRATTLPSIVVRNDHQQLDVIHGAALRVRLEQCHDKLTFTETRSAILGHNETPFLINVPGHWSRRPGLFASDQLTFQDTVLRPDVDERVRYRISNRRWVAAGTYMATTTQLTTMESANESGRHAVNAILRCLAFRPGNEYNAQGRVFADLVDIWDPEKHELDDLEPLKRLDRKLVAEGLPHVMDILKIIDYVDALPMHGSPSDDPIANVLHMFQHIAADSDREWGFAKKILNDLLGQTVERAHDVVDPFGLLRHLGTGTGDVAERVREALKLIRDRMAKSAGGGAGGAGGAGSTGAAGAG